jgi:hypothetical protein
MPVYDSPHWDWGAGYCRRHPGQGVPCRACVDGGDPAMPGADATVRLDPAAAVPGRLTLEDVARMADKIATTKGWDRLRTEPEPLARVVNRDFDDGESPPSEGPMPKFVGYNRVATEAQRDAPSIDAGALRAAMLEGIIRERIAQHRDELAELRRPGAAPMLLNAGARRLMEQGLEVGICELETVLKLAGLP